MKIRGGLAVVIAVLVLAGGIPFVVSDGADAVDDGRACDGVLIYEVAAKFGSGTNEGFSLKNYGSSSVNLKNYYLADSDSVTESHKFLITSSIEIPAGGFKTFTKAAVTDWFGDTTRSISTYDSAGSPGGSFAFTNTGDFLCLYNPSGTLIDTVVFGDGKNTTEKGWTGMPADLGNKGDAARRVESTDTDTYFDWTPINNGYTSNGFRDVPTFTGAKVTPFTFPESKGKPIFDTVMAATSSVYISIYMLNSKEMLSVLNSLADSGVDVKIMLEKKPLGYDHNYDLLKNIDNKATGSVCFIGNGDADRYSYVHNKYAIIDGDTVIVTSGNWTGGNLGGKGNRGWGAVVESTGYAAYMKTYFDNDIGGPDIQTFAGYEAEKGAVTPAALPTSSEVATFVSKLDYSTSTYTCDIKMYMSPDNTFKALQYYIDKATTRVYTEQMDVGKTYLDLSNQSPLSAMVAAAKRGADARFLLSASEAEDKQLVNELNWAGVKAANMTSNGYATMHNKGVIIDDAVWVSSVNWTENAFMNNRECGLYIMSKEVADFYAGVYNVDWEHDYDASAVPDAPADSKNDIAQTIEENASWIAIAGAVLLAILGALWAVTKKKAKKKVRKTVKKAVKGGSKKK